MKNQDYKWDYDKKTKRWNVSMKNNYHQGAFRLIMFIGICIYVLMVGDIIYNLIR